MKTSAFVASETASSTEPTPKLFSYTELDDFDDNLRKKRTEDMESQEHILEPPGKTWRR